MEVKEKEATDNKVEKNKNYDKDLKAGEKNTFVKRVLERIKKMNGKTKITIGVVLIIVVLFGVLGLNSEPNRIKIRAWSSLEEVFEKNDLETVKYTYNGIAKQCKKDNCTEDSDMKDYKYFVLYNGTVTAGIDFKEIDIEVDKSAKKLIITIPEPKITGYNVEESMKFIVNNNKYNEASEYEAALKLCKEDLESRSKEDETILTTAKQNTIIVLEAFFKPWIENFNDEYKVEIK